MYRVLSRHYGIDEPINTTRGKHTFEALASELLPAGEAGTFNQAMMDFGATLCTPRSPQCAACPVAETCIALRTGQIARLPVKENKAKVQQRKLDYIYIRHEGEVAMRRRPAGDIWQGLWEPLLVESSPLPDLGCRLIPLAQGIKHVLTHRVLYANFYLAEPSTRPVLPDGYQWIKEDDIVNHAVPRLVEKLLDKVMR